MHVSSVSDGSGDSDALYGAVRVAEWAQALLQTAPFRRLAGISLSDVPGELLFGRAFPSRLDHTLGVYYLARLARPRDRALQAAALAHDLGHGPFSHLTEPLMRERLGMDHEQRSARQLLVVRDELARLPSAARRSLDWLDWDEVGRLVTGGEGEPGVDGRGTLLNGTLDYDNIDNVARFLHAADLGLPQYDPAALARALRLNEAAGSLANESGGDGDAVYLLPTAREEALAWRADRSRVYTFLHEGHRNLALHAMLRKAIDLAARADALPAAFFEMTDAAALAWLQAAPGALWQELAGWAAAGRCYHCIWEAALPPDEQAAVPFARVADRLGLERTLAAEAGLPEQAVVLEMLTSGAGRRLPLLGQPGQQDRYTQLPGPDEAPCVIHVFVPPDAGRDYQRRTYLAASRLFARFGASPRLASP